LALLLSLFTFLKTGGIGDIKEQISIMRSDLREAREQTEERMVNRSTLFEALYHLTDAVDSLQAGDEDAAKELMHKGLEKIAIVEQRLELRKRTQLEKLRGDIERHVSSLRSEDTKGIREFEYQIRLLRIFEENL
jgi:hypothetical protein